MNSLMYFNEMTRGRGRIEVILGPMFSGKTTELIRRVKRFKLATFECIIFKYAKDSRYSKDDIASHDLQTLSAVPCHKLTDYFAKACEYEVIGIDEGQFFPDLVEVCENLANRGKIVLVAALDGTYQRLEFGDILKLVPLAESVVKLSAICMNCYMSASFTKRITMEKTVELIGGVDKYMAVCRECFHQMEKKKNEKIRNPLKENMIIE